MNDATEVTEEVSIEEIRQYARMACNHIFNCRTNFVNGAFDQLVDHLINQLERKARER